MKCKRGGRGKKDVTKIRSKTKTDEIFVWWIMRQRGSGRARRPEQNKRNENTYAQPWNAILALLFLPCPCMCIHFVLLSFPSFYVSIEPLPSPLLPTTHPPHIDTRTRCRPLWLYTTDGLPPPPPAAPTPAPPPPPITTTADTSRRPFTSS